MAQVNPQSWRARLPGIGRIFEVRAERDAARTALRTTRAERDATRRALKAARAERDAAREALSATRAERDAALAALKLARAQAAHTRAERDAAAQRSADALIKEVREIRTLQRTTDRRVGVLHREMMTDIQALYQLLHRYSPEARLPPVAGWALSPAGLLALVEAIETKGARTVVECGSGTSTLWIGYALKRLGRGRVIALDHLPEYAERTRAVVAAHGLSDFVEVRLAPLSPRPTPRGEFPWYTFDATDLTEPIDVLLVDGPPQSTGRHARYPALGVFVDHLSPGAVVIADDADRPDEREMLEFWLQEEPRLTRLSSPGVGIEVLEFAGAR